MCVPKETKDINVKAFYMIKNKNVIQIRNGIIKHVNVNIKIIVPAKKIIVGILAHVFVIILSI